jgi:hypothetical protein
VCRAAAPGFSRAAVSSSFRCTRQRRAQTHPQIRPFASSGREGGAPSKKLQGPQRKPRCGALGYKGKDAPLANARSLLAPDNIDNGLLVSPRTLLPQAVAEARQSP